MNAEQESSLPRCQKCGRNDAAWMVVASGVPGLGAKRQKLCTPCADAKPSTFKRSVLRRRDY